MAMHYSALIWLLLVGSAACGSDAKSRGVGSECGADAGECTESGQTCLAFKGGYCGIKGCVHDADCPSGSACVAHTDGMNYCFLVCAQKPDCNTNRTLENEANCSSTATFVDGTMGRKACVPPSGI